MQRLKRSEKVNEMARFIWKKDEVFSIHLRDGSYCLGQVLKSPYLVFFQAFKDVDDWDPAVARDAAPLIFCAVTRQFIAYSPIKKKPRVLPKVFADLPKYWISRFHGSRTVTVWKGTPREQTFVDLSSRPGGQLIEKHLDATGFTQWPVVMPSIPLDDDKTIDGHETGAVWLYPQLNERLVLSKHFGRAVDPDKDIQFDRPLPKDYENYINIRASNGRPEDWGYSSQKYEPGPNPGRKKKEEGSHRGTK